jgi:hypothetical protein
VPGSSRWLPRDALLRVYRNAKANRRGHPMRLRVALELAIRTTYARIGTTTRRAASLTHCASIQLKNILQCQLEDPLISSRQAARPADIALDLSEGGAIERRNGRSWIERVGQVECFAAQLQRLPFPHPESPRYRDIELENTGALQIVCVQVPVSSRYR